MDCLEGFAEHLTKWDVVWDMLEFDLNDDHTNEVTKTVQGVQLLPRQDVGLYGSIPKMEQRIYTKCKECRLIFNPRDVLSHKLCAGKAYSSTSSHSMRKKIKSKGNTPKKPHPSLPPPPLFKKPSSPSEILTELPVQKISSTKISKASTTPTVSSSPLKLDAKVPTSAPSKTHHSPKSPKSNSAEHSSKASSKGSETSSGSSTSSYSSSSSKHKKSRKSGSSSTNSSSSKVTEEYNPDLHCGVMEGNKGPCTRSVTCSNHRIQLRKLVTGRSKDIHQLIAERKIAKEKDSKYSYLAPNGLDPQEAQESYVPSLANSKDTPSEPVTTSAPTEVETKFSKTADVQIKPQEGVIGTVPVVYMPMSPISLMSPVEFVKIGKNIICLESPQSATVTSNQSMILTIPSHHPSLKMYKTHPKPVAVPSYGTKKIGGAILLSNQRIESQRNDILTATSSNHKTSNHIQSYRTLNHVNSQHRPNILKNKNVKVNCKRSSVDKLCLSDNKQIRMTTNLNGFVLHSDISESADAPQSNNIMQEKMSFLNMK